MKSREKLQRKTVEQFPLQKPVRESVSEPAGFAGEFAGTGGDKRRSVCRKLFVSACSFLCFHALQKSKSLTGKGGRRHGHQSGGDINYC